MKRIETKKDKIKLVRGTLQMIFLLFLFLLLLNTIFNFKKYKPEEMVVSNSGEDRGFVSLSYFAVDREGDPHMISVESLEEHFQALKKNGYKTMSQSDIENYYSKNQKINDKALFLFFEDGRRDTAIFTSPLLEKYNYQGTILNYADKFEIKDPKFLNPKDIERLEDSTFWEVGSNGYRLAYINVFDRYEHYLGELSSEEFVQLREYIQRDYNHYLMDFIRDEHRLPKEGSDEMARRIEKDYEYMEKIYEKELGKMPKMYALMHSNTGQFATNDRVSRINEELIEKHFEMNFNREGYSHNNHEASQYDLTRMQPQPYWSANHLLMRIQDDTKEEIEFIDGEEKIKKDWESLNGATEFKQSSLILTTTPKGKAQIRLKNKLKEKDFTFETRLTGNVLGSQKIYLNSNDDRTDYLSIEIKNNYLFIEEDGTELFSLDLDEHDEIDFLSIEEDELEALEEEYKLYDKNSKRRKNQTKMEKQEEVEEQEVATVEDGAEPYKEDLQINKLGKRELKIERLNNKLTVNIDDKEAIKDLDVSPKNSGYIFLESAWEEYGYSQRNLADDVYDGVFEDLVIETIEEETIYRNKLEGIELLKEKVKKKWHQIISWFIKNL